MGPVTVRFDEPDAIEHESGSLLFGEQLSPETHYDTADILLFDESAGDSLAGSLPATATVVPTSHRRGAQRQQRRRRRRRRILLVFVVVVIAAISISGWVAYKSLYPPKDWQGDGTGQAVVQIHSGDGSAAIGSTLTAKGVVRSAAAYMSAASHNSKSQDIAPGVYQLRKHMSAQSALNLLLNPASHIVAKVTIPEGSTEQNVITKLATALNVPAAQVTAAAADIADIGIPEGYLPTTGKLTTAEGFLFPDTYSFDPGTSPAVALQQMAAEFTTEDKQLGFADGAKKLGLTPYQALTIASMAQAEVKFPADAPKVARVILNRLASNMALKIDATSVYGAEIQGLDLTKVVYSTIDSPYNTYTHSGLPPTPIGNPGEPMLQAAISPAAGDWLYYVNGDAQGDLFFTNNEAAFEAAVAKCQSEHWGCG